MKKVFISTTSFAKDDTRPLDLIRQAGMEVSLNSLGKKLSEDEITMYLADADFLIAGTEPLTRKVISSAKKLKVISRCGVGMDNVDVQAAAESGIKVYNTPYGPTLAVAELTVGLILDLLRQVSIMDRDIRKGIWKKRMGNLLNGKKIGIIGFGRIGQKVAQLLLSFGVDISFCDVSEQTCSLTCSPKRMDELLSWADIITLHCSAPSGCKTIIGKDELSKLKREALLINASRGSLIDEDALYLALKEGRLAGAAIDVFEKEPYKGPLTELENVVLTPHIGSYAKEGRIEMEIQAVQNLFEGIKQL